MRAKLLGLLLGLGLVAGAASPTLACPFHDQQASTAAQQQTADAQGSTTTANQ